MYSFWGDLNQNFTKNSTKSILYPHAHIWSTRPDLCCARVSGPYAINLPYNEETLWLQRGCPYAKSRGSAESRACEFTDQVQNRQQFLHPHIANCDAIWWWWQQVEGWSYGSGPKTFCYFSCLCVSCRQFMPICSSCSCNFSRHTLCIKNRNPW